MMPGRLEGGFEALKKRRKSDNDETVPNQDDSNAPTTRCYHFRGVNSSLGQKMRSVDGLKDFILGSQLSSEIFKDFEIGGIGVDSNSFQLAMIQRAADAKITPPKDLIYFPSYEFVHGCNKTFDMEERKTFISSGCNHLWLEKMYGITRVAVYGVDSICVVTWNDDFVQLEKDLERLRDTPYEMDETIPYAFIFEVEDLACPPDESRTLACKRNQKPFGVVSVIAGTDEDSGDKFDEFKAIKFLRGKLNNTSRFTFRKTVKTAIRAFHRLLNKKFNPDKLRVFVWKSEWENEDYDCDYDETVQELRGNDLLAVYYNNKQCVADSAS